MTQDGNATAAIKNIILVHGGFADGSGWRAVYDRLVKEGFDVSIAQHPTQTLAGDIDYVKRVIGATNGPVLLVGHSYGGAVITGAGNDDRVAGLVYICAFAPDEGESVLALATKPVEGAVPPPFLPPEAGFLMLDAAKFPAAFAGDVDIAEATFMARSQVPWGAAAGGAPSGPPAWKHKPASYLLTTDDRMIAPATQQMMAERAKATIRRTAASHSVFISQPDVVAEVIRDAARRR